MRSTIASPCISLCKMSFDTAQQCGFDDAALKHLSPQGVCEGCFRTIDEIMAWSQADDTFKQAVWEQIYIRSRNTGSPYPDSHPGSDSRGDSGDCESNTK